MNAHPPAKSEAIVGGILTLLIWASVGVFFYVASTGPAWYFVRKGADPVAKFDKIYYPLTRLPEPLRVLLDRYITLWAPPIDPDAQTLAARLPQMQLLTRGWRQ